MKTTASEILIVILALILLTLIGGAKAKGAETNTVTVTAYCACVKCCGKWAGGPTASGVIPKQGETVAGPRNIKFGTVVEIEGLGKRVVQDRTAKKYDGRIDVFFSDHKEALKFGIRQLKVTYR